MINERGSAQANTPTSANMQYGYPPGHFDLMNIPTMQNPSDLYSYYPPSLYQPFGTFDDHSQWGSTDTSGSVQPPPGPMTYHPQMYTQSPLDIPRSPFDYPPPPHAYPHYHPGFTPSTFAGPPSTGTSGFDMSWNPHNLPMQQMQIAAQQQMTPIGGGIASNKKPSAYDEYPAGGVGDMLAQHINSVDLGNTANNDDTHNYDNGTNDGTQNMNVLSSKEHQQHYQSNTSNHSSSRPSQAPSSSGPKSYASVVSSDTINTNSNKSTPSVSNITARSTVQSSTNERNNPTSGYSNDSTNSRSNTNLRGNNNNNNMNNYSQQTRNGTGGYNSRNQQQQQQSSSGNGGFLNWTNSSLSSNSRGGGGGGNNNTSSTYYNSGTSNYYDRSSYSQQQQQPSTSSNNNKRQNANYQQNYSSSRTANNMSNGSGSAIASGQQPITAANQEILDTLKRNHQYNPKDFNLSPKGARFFVIKSYSEDDVHRSIKYNIWCSTEHGNKRLDTAFREREGKGPIYLFYSVNASGHFCGMAEMMSPLDYEHQTDVWQMSNKWQGKFEVKWIYVKDVPNQQFRNIRLENNDNKPVTNSRDTQEIPYEKGKLMLKTMHMYRDKTSIFDDFQYYESKQAEETTTKQPTNDDYNNNNNNNNNARGNNYNNKRHLSSNKTSTVQLEQQQQQQQQNENINNEEEQ